MCEGVKGGLAGGRICGAIDRAQGLRDALAILPGSKIHRMADEVDDAGLHDSLRKNGVNGLWKTLQAIHDGDQNVLGAAGLELVDDAQPEFGALGLFDPDAENLLSAVRQHAERDVDCLVAHKAFVADLDPNGIEEHQRVAQVERPVLPLRNLVQHRVSDRRDQVRRNLDAIEFLEMAADLPNRHPARIHRDDLVVEIRKPALVLGNQLGVEGAGPIPRHRKRHLRGAGQDGLLRIAIAVIRLALSAVAVQVLVELGIQDPFRQRLLQLVDQSILVEHVLRIAAGQ